MQATGTAGRLLEGLISPGATPCEKAASGFKAGRIHTGQAAARPRQSYTRERYALRRRRPAVPVACGRVSWTGWDRLYTLRSTIDWFPDADVGLT